MLKDMEFTQKIAIMQPQQTAFSKWLHTIRAACSHRLVIDADTPKYVIVRLLIIKDIENMLTSAWMLLPVSMPQPSVFDLLPSKRMTKTLKLHKSKYDYGWAVYKRNSEGKAVKAVWLLKLSDTEAHVALYVSRSRYPQLNTD